MDSSKENKPEEVVGDDGDDDDNIYPPIPIGQQLSAETIRNGGKLEVIGDDDDDNINPPIPIQQQLSAETKRNGGKLEVIGDDDDDNINPPIPIQQLLVGESTKRDRKLEVIGDDDGDNVNPPIPIEVQFSTVETKKSHGKLEVIGDDNNHIINPPIPIEQVAAALEDEEKGQQFTRMVSLRSAAADSSNSLVALGSSIVADGSIERRTDNVFSPLERPSSIPFYSSHQIAPDSDDDDIEQQLEVDLAQSADDPPFPLLEATLVDDVVYDAVAFDEVSVRPSWRKRHPKLAAGGLFLVIAAVVASAVVPSIALSGRNREQTAGSKNEDDILVVDSDATKNNLSPTTGAPVLTSPTTGAPVLTNPTTGAPVLTSPTTGAPVLTSPLSGLCEPNGGTCGCGKDGNGGVITLNRFWGDSSDEQVWGCGGAFALTGLELSQQWDSSTVQSSVGVIFEQGDSYHGWEGCCQVCGLNLQMAGRLSSGWYCEKDLFATGIWLKGNPDAAVV
ncbi:hypothetical protein ACHAWU_002745 [Discostella pseudostelligera]|uniref:Uncharacterized protein n=1 Tax=Discostella pseudostelligera TaxID=259834 RepID=A0ABD3MPV0_9STRA